MPSVPRESFTRGESPGLQQQYETSLIDLIGFSFQYPKEDNLSARQHWAMKLNRKVEDFKKAGANLPVDKVFKPFRDVEVFVEDASNLARTGDSDSFKTKWPLDLLEVVRGSFAKKESLGKLAIERSPLLTLAEAAFAVVHGNWPPTENASSTRISGMATRGASAGTTAEVDTELIEDGSTTPRASVRYEVAHTYTRMRGRSGSRSEQQTPGLRVADMTEEREVQSLPPYEGTKAGGSMTDDSLLQYSASHEEGRARQSHSDIDVFYKRPGDVDRSRSSDRNAAEADSLGRELLNRNQSVQWRSRACASLSEDTRLQQESNHSISIDPDARPYFEGSLQNRKRRFSSLEESSEAEHVSEDEEGVPMDENAPVEDNAQDSDRESPAESTNEPERKRKKVLVVSIPSRFVSPSKRDSKQRSSLKSKAGRGRGVKSAKSKSRTRPLPVKSDTTGGLRPPSVRRKRVASVKADGGTQTRCDKEVAVPASTVTDNCDDAPLGDEIKLERESDREPGDTAHNPPCVNCANRDLSCFTETGKLFGTRCRRCVRIKKHCSYSRIPLDKLKENREKAEEEREETGEEDEDATVGDRVDDAEWQDRPRRTRASTRAQTSTSAAKSEAKRRKRGAASHSRSASQITIRASSRQVFEDVAQVYDEVPQPMAPPKIIPGPRIYYRPKSESPEPGFGSESKPHPFAISATRPQSLGQETSPTPFPPPSLSQSLSATPAPFPPASISDFVGESAHRYSPGAASSVQMSIRDHAVDAEPKPKPEEVEQTFDAHAPIDHELAPVPLVDYPSSSALLDPPLSGHDNIDERHQPEAEEEPELEYIDDVIPVDVEYEAEPTSADSNSNTVPDTVHSFDGSEDTGHIVGRPQSVPNPSADGTDALSLFAMMSKLSDTPEKLKALRDLQQAFGISKDT